MVCALTAYIGWIICVSGSVGGLPPDIAKGFKMSEEKGSRLGNNFPFDNLVEVVEFYGSHQPSTPAFIFIDKHRHRYELTRRELYEFSGRWAAVLHDSGIGKGHMVVSTLPNGPERVVCDVGIIMAGAVSVNAHCQLADGSDLLMSLQETKASAVCVNPDLTSGPWSVLQQHVQYDPVTNTVTSTSLPHLHHVFFIRRKSPLCRDDPTKGIMTEVTEEKADKENGEEAKNLKNPFSGVDSQDFIRGLQNLKTVHRADVESEDFAYVFLTSGSTGFSKLVPISHKAIIDLHRFGPATNKDQFSVEFNMSPLGWVGGFAFTSFCKSKCRLLLDMVPGMPKDLSSIVWGAIVQEKCMSAFVMPFLLHKICESEKDIHWKLKEIFISGQPIRRNMIKMALRLAESVFIGYGSTETVLITAVKLSDISEFQDFMAGMPLPCNVAKVCDDQGREVSRGTRGELYVKTPFMIKQYANAPAPITADGFMKTGDIGWMREDSMLFIEGRHPDIIHRGSYIFYPFWLENRIMQDCPGLHDVMVVGVPDPAMGQELCVCFVTRDPLINQDHVRQAVESSIVTDVNDPLSPRPRYYLAFHDFPKSYTDKPVRKQLRRLAAERLNLC